MIYEIKPKEGINSRRWQADIHGVKYLEKYYSNYSDTGLNRWNEFEVNKADPVIGIDFGGGAFVGEPVIEIVIKGVTFHFFARQAQGFYNCINCDTYKSSDVWRINGRWWSTVIGAELRNAFLEIAKDNIDDWEKQFDDYYEDWLKKVKVTNEN